MAQANKLSHGNGRPLKQNKHLYHLNELNVNHLPSLQNLKYKVSLTLSIQSQMMNVS